MQKKAMKATFCLLPMACSRTIEIGSSAGGGIARQYSMCGIASLRVQRESPIGIPSATPTTTAIAKPSADPHQARHDVRAELREEPHVPELDEDRRQPREVVAVRLHRPQLPGGEDRDRHGISAPIATPL